MAYVCPANSSAYNAGAPSIWAAGAFGIHWGIYFLMRIKFRYQLLGLIFASFFDLERLFKRHELRDARKAQRWDGCRNLRRQHRLLYAVGAPDKYTSW